MYELAIFAGGMGSRLKNTESRPKPFVDINGKSLISRIIRSFNNSGIFSIIKFIYYEKLYFLSNLLKNFKLKVVKIK